VWGSITIAADRVGENFSEFKENEFQMSLLEENKPHPTLKKGKKRIWGTTVWSASP